MNDQPQLTNTDYVWQFIAPNTSLAPLGLVHWWKDNEPRPRDMSWGYVLLDGKQVHIFNRDIITFVDDLTTGPFKVVSVRHDNEPSPPYTVPTRTENTTTPRTEDWILVSYVSTDGLKKRAVFQAEDEAMEFAKRCRETIVYLVPVTVDALGLIAVHADWGKETRVT